MKPSQSVRVIHGMAAATLVVALTGAAATAAAQDEAYFPVSMCVGTNEFGEPWPAIRFWQGTAENYSETETRYLICPVPYVRNVNNLEPVIVRVHGFDNNNGSDGGIVLQLAEKFVDEGGTIHDTDSSGNAFMGFVTLEVQFTPHVDTRWLFVYIAIPDQDTQSGRSYVSGYRVCRGMC
jgi:hypothetical protein